MVITYLLRRGFSLAITLFIVSAIIFVVLRAIPGDAAELILGTEAPPEALLSLRSKLGLDRPLLAQYLGWLVGLLRGDLGTSLRHERSVSSLIIERLPVTLSLSILAMTLALSVAIPSGVIAGQRRGALADYGLMAFAQLGTSLPSFWIAILLIFFFSLTWHLLPPGGYASWLKDPLEALKHLAMPALALGGPLAAVLARMTRSAVAEAMGGDYIYTARSKGLSERAVVYRHALKNALIPTVTVIGLQAGSLLGGSIIVEQVFYLPGLGRLTLFAVYNRDLPLIQGLTLFLTALVVAVSFAVDLIYTFLDPRLSISDV